MYYGNHEVWNNGKKHSKETCRKISESCRKAGIGNGLPTEALAATNEIDGR
jgi:hypothetical protein